MITRGEIEEKSREFGIHVANVRRDYVFGWLPGRTGASRRLSPFEFILAERKCRALLKNIQIIDGAESTAYDIDGCN
jgi:hypothetical protein